MSETPKCPKCGEVLYDTAREWKRQYDLRMEAEAELAETQILLKVATQQYDMWMKDCKENQAELARRDAITEEQITGVICKTTFIDGGDKYSYFEQSASDVQVGELSQAILSLIKGEVK